MWLFVSSSRRAPLLAHFALLFTSRILVFFYASRNHRIFYLCHYFTFSDCNPFIVFCSFYFQMLVQFLAEKLFLGNFYIFYLLHFLSLLSFMKYVILCIVLYCNNFWFSHLFFFLKYNSHCCYQFLVLVHFLTNLFELHFL